MVDQEGGLVKRIGGAPNASAQEMGERGAAFSRAAGPADRAEPAQHRRQRRPRAGARTSPGPGGHRRRRTRLRLDPGRRRGDRRSRSPRGSRAAGSPRPQSTSRIRLRQHQHRFRGPDDRSSRRRTLRRVDEAPYRGFVDAGGDVVMLSDGDLLRPSRTARPPSPARSRPVSCAIGSASRASRSPMRSRRSQSAISAAPTRPASPAPGPASTSCSTPIRRPPGSPTGR